MRRIELTKKSKNQKKKKKKRKKSSFVADFACNQ